MSAVKFTEDSDIFYRDLHSLMESTLIEGFKTAELVKENEKKKINI